MFSTPGLKDGNVIKGDGIHMTEQGQSENPSTSQVVVESTEKCETKMEEASKSTQEWVKDENKSVVVSSEESEEISPIQPSVEDESEETKSSRSTSTVSIEAVKSPAQNPTGSTDVHPLTGRVLLKRRRSRMSMPIVLEPIHPAEEVDSAPPRPSKRRTQKKQVIALFLESDYPRRK